MGKNRHSKDKLYIVASEYATDWGGYKTQNNKLPFRCLPFDCCFLSLLPFKNPLGTVEGLVFDADEITAYIKQYGHNPITGKSLTMKDLFVLRFHKNTEGKYFCPITEKQFNNHSFIVANRKTGHVYSNEAIDILCRKTKHWLDLITNEPFSSTDLVILQNPNNYDLRKIENFYYRQEGIKIASHTMREKGTPSEMGAFDPKMKSSLMTSEVLHEVKVNEDDLKLKHNNLNINKNNVQTGNFTQCSSGVEEKGIKKKHALFTTHREAASFTSTVVNISNDLEYRDLTSKESRQEMYKIIKKNGKKGYVRLETTVGPLNFELHCDKVPETCFNFLLHCRNNYYRGTKFHRSIKNFMIQGGDPLGNGTGGISAFGENEPEFDDEFHPHLVHKGPGILSMANKGKNTNRSQFFITYNSCEHLNNQHSVFGQLVGGFATLTKLQNIPTTKNDAPKELIEILECIVYEDPFHDYFQEEKMKEDQVHSNEKIPLDELLDPMKTHEKRYSSQVGKYADLKKIIQQQQVSQRKKIKN